MSPSNHKRLVIIGAGPIGLSAALMARSRGHDVTVFEKGGVGGSLRRWGASTRLFSPMSMNLPPIGREVLGPKAPPGDALLTGPQLADDVLAPIAESALLEGRVLTDHRVVAVGRAGLTRTDLAGHPLRAERPFRILVESGGRERVVEADLVFDASGVHDNPNFAGPGGLPAVGERALASRLIRRLGELEQNRVRPAGRVLLVGHGHSAANAVLHLEAMAMEDPGLRVTWAVRSANLRPCPEVADDPLPERARVVCRANDLAAGPPAFLAVARRACIAAIAPEAERFRVTLSMAGGRDTADATFDQVIALTGYRPDLSMLAELPIEISPVTGGSAGLSRALSQVTDCLSLPAVTPRDLGSGEEGFYMVGSKSYGRSPAFLLRTGLAHLEIILDGVAG